MKNIFDFLAELGEKYYEANSKEIRKRIDGYNIPFNSEDD
jgi:hypothetical protein